MNVPAIVRKILQGYRLPVRGDHGVGHWARVMENGLRVADATGADRRVVILFALFHDAGRVNEHHDPGHGRRGAELAASSRGRLFDLDDRAFALLAHACELHDLGQTSADPTVGACWDADRLDLGRVGVVPRPEFLSTEWGKGRGLLEWAHARAMAKVEPMCVTAAWRVGRPPWWLGWLGFR